MDNEKLFKMIGPLLESTDVASGLVLCVRDGGIKPECFIPGAHVAIQMICAKMGMSLETLKGIYQELLRVYAETKDEYVEMYDKMGKADEL